ncbi:MAG TPA: glycosyltransferase family 4 protein, partial [Longimicrobium sp.]|nr:glycosyltransferase family 4 protein [Longimicrobium sp.]
RRVVEKGVCPDDVTVIPNGVDAALYHPAQEPPPLPGMERADGELLVGYLGNFGASQNIPALVEAAARLEAAGERVRVVLAGDGTDRERVLACAARAGLRSLAVHGSIPKERTRAFYNACDACLVPLAAVAAMQETIPSKLFEVMACEVPVVLSAAGEAAAVVERSGCGVVAAPADPEAIAAAILRVRDAGADARARMGRAGGEYVRRNFDRSALAGRYLELLARVAGRAAGGEPR